MLTPRFGSDTPRFRHLGLVDWPFYVVPDLEHCDFMADRKCVREDINKILTFLARRDQSAIYVLWAWYGAGKTHTLYYLANRCKTNHADFLPIYNEFPKDTRSFLDLYRGFISGIDFGELQDAYLEVFTSPRKNEVAHQLGREFPDLFHALKALTMETPSKAAIADTWIRSENVSARDLRAISVAERIDRPEKALLSMTWLVHLFNWSGQGNTPRRIIWMLDEFQRVTSTRQPVQDQVNGCLQSIFNRSPRGFALLLSFSGNPSKKLPEWLSHELADRIGMERVITLPPLGPCEAQEFILDVLAHYRDHEVESSSVYFPFSKGAIDALIDHVRKGAQLKPRTLMQACNAVLEEADLKIQGAELALIDERFVSQILGSRSFLETEASEAE